MPYLQGTVTMADAVPAFPVLSVGYRSSRMKAGLTSHICNENWVCAILDEGGR